MLENYLDRIEHETRELTAQPYPPDDEEGYVADAVGRLAKIIRDLGTFKRGLMSEVSRPLIGVDYQLTEGRSAKRSYNSAAILSAFEDKGWGIGMLASDDVVRLGWQWTKLKAALTEADITLTIAAHEVEDLGDIDAPMVGEVWDTTYGVEGVER